MNDLSGLILLGMMPCFGMLVVPRYGQTIHFFLITGIVFATLFS